MKCILLVSALIAASAAQTIDPAKEMKFFGTCNGKEVKFPPSLVSDATGKMAECGFSLGMDANRFCIGTCVMEKMGVINADRTYNMEKVKKLLKGTSDPEITEIHLGSIKKCTEGKKFMQDGKCKAAEELDVCARKEQVEKCGAKM